MLSPNGYDTPPGILIHSTPHDPEGKCGKRGEMHESGMKAMMYRMV